MEKPMEIRKNSLLEKLENYGKTDFEFRFHFSMLISVIH